jgi:hypothetical protein
VTSVAAAALHYGVCERTIWRWLAADRLESFRPPSIWDRHALSFRVISELPAHRRYERWAA